MVSLPICAIMYCLLETEMEYWWYPRVGEVESREVGSEAYRQEILGLASGTLRRLDSLRRATLENSFPPLQATSKANRIHHPQL